MTPKLTYHDVAHGLSQRPCKDDFKQAVGSLPDWKTTAYGPAEMAEHGVKHSSILWAFLRPEVIGRAAMIEAACRMAERVLPIFEAEYPGDLRPRQAIEAARKCVADPSEENKDAAAARAAAWAAYAAADAAAARAAAWAAYAAADAAAWAAWAAGDAAWAAADAAARAADAAAYATNSDDEKAAQIQILEDIIAEYGEAA